MGDDVISAEPLDHARWMAQIGSGIVNQRSPIGDTKGGAF